MASEPSQMLEPCLVQSNVGAQTEQMQAGGDKSTPKKTKNSIKPFCSICLVSLTSESQAEVHFSGEKHKRTLVLMTANAGVYKSPEEYCGVCHIPFNSPLIAQAHYAGSKHEKKIKLAQVNPGGDNPNVQSQLYPLTQPPPTFQQLPPPNFAQVHFGVDYSNAQSQLYPLTQPTTTFQQAQPPPNPHQPPLPPQPPQQPPPPPLDQPQPPISEPLVQTYPQTTFNNTSAVGNQQNVNQSNVNQQNLNQSQGQVLQPGSLLFCSFCNISVNSLAQMDAHRNGSKHQNKVKGMSAPPNKKFRPNTPAGTAHNPGYSKYIPQLQKSFVFGGSTGENYGQTV